MRINFFNLALAGVCVLMLGACEKRIPGKTIQEESEPLWGPDVTLYQVSSFGNASGDKQINMYLKDSYKLMVRANLTKAAKSDVSFTVAYDDSYTAQDALPASHVSIANEGALFVEQGRARTAELEIAVSTFGDDLQAGTYKLPIKLTTTDSQLQVPETVGKLVYDVTLATRIDNTDKSNYNNVKNIFCVETNDTNPLNALDFVMEDGKYFYNYVILFSGNINYSSEQNRVYVNNNSGIQILLSEREKFLVPLQQQGFKVLLGLLGNHDASGLAQLSDKGAKQFADDVKNVIETYDLDGVLYDDEYSNSPDLSNDLFASKSTERAARLMYEVKKRIPNKICGAFVWGSMTGYESIDGVQAKDFVDFLVANYGSKASPYGGMDKTWCTGLSKEMNLGSGQATEAAGKSVVDDGYGYTFFFAPYVGGYHTKEWTMANDVCKGLYGIGLKPQEFWYEKNVATPTLLKSE